MCRTIDIAENEINELSPQLLKILLKDHSASHHYKSERSIIWATSDYKKFGEGYGYNDQIKPELIIGEHGEIIRPRARKSLDEQRRRITEKAEVFTPAWICNKQNNLVDNAWFGRENVFNTEIDEVDHHSWITTDGKIQFSDNQNKTWQDYVCAPRLEVACGEAPYITSRYDTTLCDMLIPIKDRIGLLDRKLRIVGENTNTPEEWLVWGFNALHATYGFEWQGDNLLLAREAVLYTFMEHFKGKFQQDLEAKTLENAAYIISWNLWQMDGLKFVIPGSCHEENNFDLFGNNNKTQCLGCRNGYSSNSYLNHNGIYCDIMDWNEGHTLKFVSLVNKKR